MNLFYRKILIAATGLFLCLFLIVHLSANCILLFPEDIAQEMYNSYSTALRENIFVKIIAYVLYASIIIHVLVALVITLKNRRAQPQAYLVNKTEMNSSWASQNMGLIGVLILVFIVIHLAQFWARIKFGLGEEVSLDNLGNKDVYQVTKQLFQNIYIVIFYALLMVPLGLHLHHGVMSAFKSLGFYHSKGLVILKRISLIYALVISVLFGIIPFIVYLK